MEFIEFLIRFTIQTSLHLGFDFSVFWKDKQPRISMKAFSKKIGDESAI
jgi:hypothetical protein